MKYLIIILLLLTCATSIAQVNFVANPSFEEYSQCPDNGDGIAFANHWSAIDSNGNQYCTPEYCHTCGTHSLSSLPANQNFYQYPRNGSGLAVIQTYYDQSTPHPYFRDYLLGRLTSQLENNKSYCVTFYVNFVEMSEYFVDKVGAYLDDGSICNVFNCSGPLTQFQPQVENTSGLITDTLNWVKIEGSFTSDGTERFITIGNFYNLAGTNAIPAYNQNIGYSWLLIDDVSIVETDLEAYAGPDTWVVEGDSVFIGRNEIVPGCTWLVNGTVVDSGAGIWVHPTATTTYVVEQTICGLAKTDTVVVSVFPVSVNGITNGQQVSIYPNPATSELLVKQEKHVFTQAVIYNQLGQQVSEHLLNDKETKVNIANLPVGVYQISLEGDKGKEIRRFVKM